MNQVIFKKETHQYFDESGREYPSVTKILKHFGMTPDFDRFGNDVSRDFGKAVHKVCELYDLGTLNEYAFDPQIEPYLNGYKKFIKEFNPQWELIEVPLISNVWGFAGTPDRVGLIKGIRWGTDLKTGSPHPSHELQTSGYDVLTEENLKIKTKKRASLYLTPDDFRLVEHKSRSDRSVFIGLVNAYNWKLKHGGIK